MDRVAQVGLGTPCRSLQAAVVKLHRVTLAEQHARGAIGDLQLVVLHHHHAERHAIEQGLDARQLFPAATKRSVHMRGTAGMGNKPAEVFAILGRKNSPVRAPHHGQHAGHVAIDRHRHGHRVFDTARSQRLLVHLARPQRLV